MKRLSGWDGLLLSSETPNVRQPDGCVLLQLRRLCLEGRHDPVDDLEQPVFAWK